MKDIYDLILKYKNLNFYDKGNKINIFKDNENKSFENLLNLCYNYPVYPNLKHGNRILLDIRKYLISIKINIR